MLFRSLRGERSDARGVRGSAAVDLNPLPASPLTGGRGSRAVYFSARSPKYRKVAVVVVVTSDDGLFVAHPALEMNTFS